MKESVLGGLMLLGGGIWYASRETPYATFYQEKIKGARGERFIHPLFIKEIHPTSEEESVHIGKLQKGLPSGAKILKNTFYEGKAFYGLTVTDEVFREYTQRIKQGLTDFMTYAGIEKQMPHVSFELFTSDTNIRGPTQSDIPLYIAHECLDMKLAGKHLVEWNGQRKELASVLEENVGGEMTHDLQYEKKQDAITISPQGTKFVLISGGINPLKSYNSPLAEVMHIILWPYTVRNIERATNTWYAGLNGTNSAKFTPEEKVALHRHLEQGVMREEGVVHAALDLFIRERRKKLGLTETEVEKSEKKQAEESRYKYIDQIKEAIRQRGCRNVVADYQRDTSTLFK